jgi:(1->4)-alpha-D-glucan 1-alpha-D-glucosylmutase
MGVPRATYRLQLQPGFGFDQAAALAEYLHDLGVSHVYSSPYLQAAPGSTHGYDVVDPRRVNAELGGPVAHQHFSERLGQHGLGQVLDIVPNHMAINTADNPYWWDVLESGPSSIYARYFDVEWDAVDPHFRNTVLLPVLSDHYGRILEAGGIALARDQESFVLTYEDRTFPVSMPSLATLLGAAGQASGSDELAVVAEHMAALPTGRDETLRERRHRLEEVLGLQLRRLLATPEIATAVDELVARVNADTDRLDELIEQQNYRLAYWRVAREDLDYRRFFDVTELAGLRMEDPTVFAETHRLIFDWLATGVLDGLRVDHPDGLRDPKGYFERLRTEAPNAWIVAEKILEPNEELPANWPIAGTTGYDFLNLVNRLYTDPSGEAPLTELYEEIANEKRSFAEVAEEAKRQIVSEVQASEVNRLTDYLAAVVIGHRRQRDYSRGQLRAVLRELLIAFPVYRTYVEAESGTISRADSDYINKACALAISRRPDLPGDLFEFVADLLLLRVRGERESEFVMRFQQVTGPVMAKGIEDTAFYRYNRLVSANEVGGDPGTFSATVSEFHEANVNAVKHWPGRMLASTTHDTKRSEDVRARVSTLSEMPAKWRTEVKAWRRLTASGRGALLDANTEYLVYQTLAGTWPISAERLLGYVQKVVREQKLATSWTDPDEEYERAVSEFVGGILENQAFVERVDQFVAGLAPAWQVSALAQALLKLTAPGVPDIYQGTETWDFSLVDPDNRRPVDYDMRRTLLDTARMASARQALEGLSHGLTKIWLIHRVLALRTRLPEAFALDAAYQPLEVRGGRAEHVVAFMRGADVVVVVPRLLRRLGWPRVEWAKTTVQLPAGTWRDELSELERAGGRVALKELLDEFPMALLVRSS